MAHSSVKRHSAFLPLLQLVAVIALVLGCVGCRAEEELVPGTTLLARGAAHVERINNLEKSLGLWYTSAIPVVTHIKDTDKIKHLLDRVTSSEHVLSGELWESNSTRLFRYWATNRSLEKVLSVRLAEGWVDRSEKVANYADPSVCSSLKGRYALVTPDLDDKALKLVRFVSGFPEPSVTVFSGCENSATALHYDNARTVFIQLRGQKRFVLFSPDDSMHAYYAPTGHPYYRHSLLEPADFASPINFDRFPFAASLKGRAFFVDLNAGEALVVPKRWSHFVVSLTNDSLGLSARGSVDERAKKASSKVPLPFESDWTIAKKNFQLMKLQKALFPDSTIRLRYKERWLKAIELSRGKDCATTTAIPGMEEVESEYQEKIPIVVTDVRARFKPFVENESVITLLLMDFMDDVVLTILTPEEAIDFMLRLPDVE